MNRKHALIIMLLLCLASGIVSAVFVWMPDGVATLPTASSKPVQVSLSAPAWIVQDPTAPPVPTEAPEEPVITEAPATPAPTEVPTPEPEPQYTYIAIHKSQKLFIRDNNSITAKVIGYLNPGDTGEVVSIGPAWVLLKHGELEGYVFKEYLQLEELPATP